MSSLDYLNLIGLKPTGQECFHGRGVSATAAGGTTSGGGSGTTTEGTATEWLAIPAEAVELLSQYTSDLINWLTNINTQARALSKSRDVTTLAPYVPNVISTVAAGGAIVATGGAALPAVATVMATQAVMNLVGTAVQNYAATLDENSFANLFKKAFLYDREGSLTSILKTAWLYADQQDAADLKSILQTALLYVYDNDKEELGSVLKEELGALKFNDEIVDFGPFRVHLRGKIIDY